MTKANAHPKPKPEPEPTAKAQPSPRAGSGAGAGAGEQAKPKAGARTQPEPRAGARAGAGAQPKPKPRAGAQPKPKRVTRSGAAGRQPASGATRVYLEQGRTWVFAAALDWPGWCRRGKGDEAAVGTLLDYAGRYALVAGAGFAPGSVTVVGQVKGSTTTDFGAPDIKGPWDDEPLRPAEADRLVGLLESCWPYFDAVAATAPERLRKGPRGGGRDRDAIIDHVREAERAYSAKFGDRVPPRTPWDEQRAAIAAALRAAPAGTEWPVRYSIRRLAWHVLDHAWEIEDKSERTRG